MLLLNKQNNIEKNDIEKIIANSKIKKILWEENIDKWIIASVIQIIINFFKIILSIFIVLFKLIIVIVKIIVLAILFWFVFIFIFLVPLVFFPWVIDNQIIFSFVPDIVKYSFIIIEISLVLFFTYILLSLTKSKFSKNWIFTFAIISIIIWLNWMVYGWYNIFYNYWQSFDKIEKYNFDIKEFKEIKLEWLENLNLKLPIILDDRNCLNCNIIPTTNYNIIDITWTGLEIEIKTTINNKNKQEADKYFTKLNNLNFSLEWNKLILKTPRDKQFKEIVPYQFIRRTIIIKKQKDLQIIWLDKEIIE
jgi:hypothetical protein